VANQGSSIFANQMEKPWNSSKLQKRH
jgi:hypothetical protein